MKFKISDRFWSSVQTVLDEQNMKYQWNENENFGILTIEDHPHSIINFQKIISEKLANYYQHRKQSKSCTVNQLIQEYIQIFKDCKVQSQVCQSLNDCLLSDIYVELKNKVAANKKVLGDLIKQNKSLQSLYLMQSSAEEQKIELALNNIDLRVKFSRRKNEDTEEELKRINNLLKNGMWGLLPQVSQKLARIDQLKAQISNLQNQ